MSGKAEVKPIIGDDGRTELRRWRPCAQFWATHVNSVGAEPYGNEGGLHVRSKGSGRPGTAGQSSGHGGQLRRAWGKGRGGGEQARDGERGGRHGVLSSPGGTAAACIPAASGGDGSSTKLFHFSQEEDNGPFCK
jgi:hypothetical protein